MNSSLTSAMVLINSIGLLIETERENQTKGSAQWWIDWLPRCELCATEPPPPPPSAASVGPDSAIDPSIRFDWRRSGLSLFCFFIFVPQEKQQLRSGPKAARLRQQELHRKKMPAMKTKQKKGGKRRRWGGPTNRASKTPTKEKTKKNDGTLFVVVVVAAAEYTRRRNWSRCTSQSITSRFDRKKSVWTNFRRQERGRDEVQWAVERIIS